MVSNMNIRVGCLVRRVIILILVFLDFRRVFVNSLQLLNVRMVVDVRRFIRRGCIERAIFGEEVFLSVFVRYTFRFLRMFGRLTIVLRFFNSECRLQRCQSTGCQVDIQDG